MCSTPVALAIFHRPALTAQVLDAVRAVRPKRLYVIADGPRADKPGEAQACAATRAIIDTVDWDCEVHKHYSDTNMGCGYRLASGFDWLFEQVESAIILEDDCIPHPSFFGYCEEVLERYRDDERVMHVSGCTYRAEAWDTDDSFFFSRFPACWGWATWRRAWQHFDITCKAWPALRETRFMSDLIQEPTVEKFWGHEFDMANNDEISQHTWDYQWAFACWANSGLAVCPRHNLISNVGSGEDATHTFNADRPSMNLPTFDMPLPLKHPEHVLANADLDRKYVTEFLLPECLPRRRVTGNKLTRAVKRAMPKALKHRIKQLIR